ncbi:MAG TPA: alanine racemase [Deltaproteobacteria bacterium]|nr:alanine racemase [Deltaproteobacteria bacterium]
MRTRKNTFARPVTRAEINLGAVNHNLGELKRLTAPSAAIMAVVKADAYGHGAVEVAKTLVEQGVPYLAVARFSEAMVLRHAGLAVPILLFGHTYPEYLHHVLHHDIWPSINTIDSARMLSEVARGRKKKVRVHVKIDTGMGRLGVLCDGLALPDSDKSSRKRAVQSVLEIASLPRLEVEGIYTHFANADHPDTGQTALQFSLFMDILSELKKNGLEPRFRHAANSAALIRMPETHLELVRPGIALYGLSPSAVVSKAQIDLKPVMSIKTSIIQLKNVPSGFKVSYGGIHQTERPTTLATVPIGYADAYSRRLSSKGYMLVRGQKAPIVGRVCMDLTVLDVGHITGVVPEDEVVVLGRQGDNEITADEIAEMIQTIHYEIISTITARVPRIFVR